METKIPKLARNKYNYIQGADGNKYMTQSQLSSMGGGGNSGNSWNNQAMYKVEQMLNERGYATNDDITYMGYITSSYAETYYATKAYVNSQCEDVKNAAYAYADSKINDVDLSSYITKDELDAILLSYDYDTKPNVNTKIANYTTKNIIPSETTTYTLGSSTYMYDTTYTYSLYINNVPIDQYIKDIIDQFVQQ